MDTKTGKKNRAESAVDATTKITLAILAIIAIPIAMVMHLNFELPSGKEVTFTGFVIFWHREIIILGLVLFALVAKILIGNKRNNEDENP